MLHINITNSANRSYARFADLKLAGHELCSRTTIFTKNYTLSVLSPSNDVTITSFFYVC